MDNSLSFTEEQEAYICSIIEIWAEHRAYDMFMACSYEKKNGLISNLQKMLVSEKVQHEWLELNDEAKKAADIICGNPV